MTVYLDTSFILPVLLERHENHQSAKEQLQNLLVREENLVTSTHTMGELYRHLTRNVPPFELTSDEADDIIIQKLPAILSYITIDKNVYKRAINRCARLKSSGAIIYDALHYETAVKVKATQIITDNTKDFTRLLLPSDTIEIKGVR